MIILYKQSCIFLLNRAYSTIKVLCNHHFCSYRFSITYLTINLLSDWINYVTSIIYHCFLFLSFFFCFVCSKNYTFYKSLSLWYICPKSRITDQSGRIFLTLLIQTAKVSLEKTIRVYIPRATCESALEIKIF